MDLTSGSKMKLDEKYSLQSQMVWWKRAEQLWVSSCWHIDHCLVLSDRWPWWPAGVILCEHQLPGDTGCGHSAWPPVSQPVGLSSIQRGCTRLCLMRTQRILAERSPLTVRRLIWAGSAGDGRRKWPPDTPIVPPALRPLPGVEQSILWKCPSECREDRTAHTDYVCNSKAVKFQGAESLPVSSSFCVSQENVWERDLGILMWEVQDLSRSTGLRDVCTPVLLVRSNHCRWRDKGAKRSLWIHSMWRNACWQTVLLISFTACSHQLERGKQLLWLLVSAHPKEPDTRDKSQSERDETIRVYRSLLWCYYTSQTWDFREKCFKFRHKTCSLTTPFCFWSELAFQTQKGQLCPVFICGRTEIWKDEIKSHGLARQLTLKNKICVSMGKWENF